MKGEELVTALGRMTSTSPFIVQFRKIIAVRIMRTAEGGKARNDYVMDARAIWSEVAPIRQQGFLGVLSNGSVVVPDLTSRFSSIRHFLREPRGSVTRLLPHLVACTVERNHRRLAVHDGFDVDGAAPDALQIRERVAGVVVL